MLNEIDRVFNTLSGGEKQRVLLARALAQQADILLLDEPTNNLDIGYQYQMFELLKELPFTIFMIVHDLNLASLFCDKIAVIQAGGSSKTERRGGHHRGIAQERVFCRG